MKLIYFNIITALVTGILVVPLAIFRPRDVRNLRPIGWFWTTVFSCFGTKYEVRNGEHLVSDKPFVLVSNHQSSLDVIALMRFLPDRCTVLAKKELLYAGTFGIAAWLSGIIFVDRLNRDKSRETMNNTARMLHEKNIKLWIYPEGTRHLGDDLLPFRKGAFHLAVAAQVPIVPVVLSTYRRFYDKKKKIFEPGRVIIQCLPPISTVGLSPDDVTDFTDEVRSKMSNVFHAISEEVMASDEAPELGENKVD